MKKEIFFLICVFVALLLIIPIICSQDSSDNSATNNSTIESITTENITNTTLPSIEMIGFIPQTFRLGDVQFNIRVKNNKNDSIFNIVPLISGRGFSTYDIVPIDYLLSGEKDYIIVNGNFRESGNITLTIKINKDIFYQNVLVMDASEEQKKQEEEKKEILKNLSEKLNELKKNYSALESDYFDKKEMDYDLSKVSLDTLKNYIKTIDNDILLEDVRDANAKMKLAYEEYQDQKTKLDSTKKRSLVARLKDNALIFSTIAGALITFFALYELLKRKSENVVVKIREIKPRAKVKKKI